MSPSSLELSAALAAAGIRHEPLEDGDTLGVFDPLSGCAVWSAVIIKPGWFVGTFHDVDPDREPYPSVTGSAATVVAWLLSLPAGSLP